jgi:hypothetical protein
MNTRKSRVSVHRTIPTRIRSYDFRASGEAATTIQDASKNGCLPTVPTEALRRLWGGEPTFAEPIVNGEVAPKPDLRAILGGLPHPTLPGRSARRMVRDSCNTGPFQQWRSPVPQSEENSSPKCERPHTSRPIPERCCLTAGGSGRSLANAGSNIEFRFGAFPFKPRGANDRRDEMQDRRKVRVISFIIAFAVFGLLSGEALSTNTVHTTTQNDVKEQCKGKKQCLEWCGSTVCGYDCVKPKKVHCHFLQ